MLRDVKWKTKKVSGWSRLKKSFAITAGVVYLLFPQTGFGSEIILHLSGKMDFPGILTLNTEQYALERVCFLGEDAWGNVDAGFLQTLGTNGIPEGEYGVTEAFPEEQWPDRSFSINGALRLVPQSDSARKQLASSGKRGLAIHGKDFFPLATRMTNNPKMIHFISDRLFEQLSNAWGLLRISNWDMGRFYDYYRRNTVRPEVWKVKVVPADLAEIKKICEPLKVRRKPGGPLE